jgi:NAD(P)H-nitrite reductase large subunit
MHTRAAVARACGAGGDCGGCRPAIDELIKEERIHMAEASHEHDAPRAHHSARHGRLQVVGGKRAATSG